jgi:hypothetical protein
MKHRNQTARRAVLLGTLYVSLAILVGGASVAFAALTFSGTSISGDSGVVIDGSSTISIGTSSATGVTIGNASATVSLFSNVGIGTTTPLSPLSVVGNFSATGAESALVLASATGTQSAYGGASACTAGNAVTTISATGGTTCSAFLTSTTGVTTFNGSSGATTYNIAAGTGISVSTTTSLGTITNTGVTSFNGATGTATYAVTCASGCTVTTTTTSTALTVTPTGTLGTGTPFYFPYWNSAGTALSATSSLFISTSTGNVGIGTMNPSTFLEVSGTAKFDSGIITPGTVFDARAYGVKADGQVCYGMSFNDSTTTITTPTSCPPFASTDVGKYIWGTNGGDSIYNTPTAALVLGADGSAPPTITAYTDAHDIVVSTAPSANTTSAGILYWGHDDTAALSAVGTAAGAVCGQVVLPAGRMMTTTGQFNTNAAICQANIGSWRAGMSVVGAGANATYIVPAPNLTGCTGGQSGEACFLGAPGMVAHDLQIFGLNNQSIGSGFSGHFGVEINGDGANASIRDVNLVGWGGNTAGFTGLLISETSQTPIYNVQADGFGYNVCEIGTSYSPNQAGQAIIGVSMLCGDSAGPGLTVLSTFFESFGGVWGIGPNANPAGGTNEVNVSYGTFYSHGDTWQGLPGGNGSALYISHGGNVRLDSAYIDNEQGATSPNFAVSLGSGATAGASLTLLNSFLKSGQTGGVGIYAPSSSTLNDLGGNTITAATQVEGGIVLLGGSPSITGVMVADTNIKTTSGWGATSGILSSVSGGPHGGQFTITATGTPGASPVITFVFPNPFWLAPNYCTITQIGGTFGVLSNPVPSSLSTTGVVFTWTGTPVAAQSYVFAYQCGQ